MPLFIALRLIFDDPSRVFSHSSLEYHPLQPFAQRGSHSPPHSTPYQYQPLLLSSTLPRKDVHKRSQSTALRRINLIFTSAISIDRQGRPHTGVSTFGFALNNAFIHVHIGHSSPRAIQPAPQPVHRQCVGVDLVSRELAKSRGGVQIAIVVVSGDLRLSPNYLYCVD
jgi:hypothetical protein